MGLTVKVNGAMNGLVHKGSNHMAKNTAPDVCKTPSPAGPVPIPYPVIISMASDLASGSTTVKADGGNSIAIKDCEYSMCTGDEAGTVGGVVSNTFKKEAKFILFSFDVKMDGKNACRLGDKMTMNHQNTFCMGGTFPTSCKPNEYPLRIDCEKMKKEKGWTDCMCKQLCAKVKAFNNKTTKRIRLNPSPGHAEPGSAEYKKYRAGINQFVKSFNKKVKQFGANSNQVRKQFYHKCQHEEWKNRPEADRLPMDRSDSNLGNNPDHIQDAALNGSLSSRNLRWLNSKVNQQTGRCMKGFKPEKHKTIKTNPNCKCR